MRVGMEDVITEYGIPQALDPDTSALVLHNWAVFLVDQLGRRHQVSGAGIRLAVALGGHPNLSVASLRVLVEGPDYCVAAAVGNPRCPVELLTAACTHPDPRVRRVVMMNRVCPDEDKVFAVLLGECDTTWDEVSVGETLSDGFQVGATIGSTKAGFAV